MSDNSDEKSVDRYEGLGEDEEQEYIKQLALEDYKKRVMNPTFDPEVLAMFNKPIGDLMEALGKAQINYKVMKLSGHNPAFHSSYPTYDDMVLATRDALVAEKLTIAHLAIKDKAGESFFLYTVLYHTPSSQYLLQSFPIYSHEAPEFINEPDSDDSYGGGDRGYQKKKPRRANKQQMMGSEMTYGKRYLYALVAGVSLGFEDDGNAAENGSGNQSQGNHQNTGNKQNSGGNQTSGSQNTTGQRTVSKSETNCYTLADELKITKEKLESAVRSKFKIKNVTQLRPKEWQAMVATLNKLKGRINTVCRILSIEPDHLIRYVAAKTSWHKLETVMDDIISKKAVAIEALMTDVSAWLEEKRPAKNVKEPEATGEAKDPKVNGNDKDTTEPDVTTESDPEAAKPGKEEPAE